MLKLARAKVKGHIEHKKKDFPEQIGEVISFPTLDLSNDDRV